MVIISTGALCLFIWIYLLAAHGGFWRLAGLTDPRRSGQARPASVAVAVPARNEADVVGLCLASLLQQASGNPIHVYLVDDGSTDGTAQVAEEAARGAGQAAALTVIAGKPIAAGWSGKLWAVQQGIEKALAQQPDYLLLTDADILHGPENISTLIQIAEDGSYDLVSFMVKLHCRTLAEKLLIPAFVFFFLKLYPPAWIADPHRRTAGAAGGCILIRPKALARAGGIESIRGEIIDDCALANRVKRSGGRIWLGLTTKTQSIRPYGSFREIGRMISRAAFNQLHHSVWILLLALLGLGITYLLPPALAFSHFYVRSWIPTLLGSAAWLLMSVAFLPTIRLYGLNPLWSLLLPLVAVFYMGATVHSAWKFWRGQGGEWKGRVQDPSTRAG